MKKISLSWSILIGGIVLMIMNTGCLKNQFEEQEQEEKNKINTYLKSHGFNETHNIGNGIYLKFANDTNETEGIRPATGQTIIVSFTGKYTDGTIFECTDSATGVTEFDDRYVVYGPHRLIVGYLISGIDYAIRKFQVGDEGTIVIPSEYAFYDYEPVVYDIKLLKIIENDSIYEMDSLFSVYQAQNGFNEADSALFGQVYYKGIPKPDTLITDGDSVKVKIVGRYAEDYYDSHLGRVFFPLYDAKEEIKWKYGSDDSFPVNSTVEKALSYMAVGDTMDILCPSSYAYGKTGFYNPYLIVAIVPGYMPIHYRLILTGIIKQ